MRTFWPVLHLAGEDAAERQEATLISGGDHLGDVQHERTVGVAVADSLGVLVVEGTLVEGVRAVLWAVAGDGK